MSKGIDQRDELARIALDVMFPPNGSLPDDPMTWPATVHKIADAVLAAGYSKADHTEYAADHKFAGLEFADEDDALFTERDYFEGYFDEYGNATLMQREVGPWVPLEPVTA